jgi:hypothetical protein
MHLKETYNQMIQRLVTFANTYRLITFSLMFLILISSFVFVSIRKVKRSKTNTAISTTLLKELPQRKSRMVGGSFSELFGMYSDLGVLEEISQKDSLSQSDSLKLKDIKQKLFKN